MLDLDFSNRSFPFITIIIATKNVERDIAACLESIIAQNFRSLEIIIMDAASTDHTLNIINRYRDFIAHVSSQRDSGIYEAWNNALQIATGEYVCFLGADDRLLPGALREYLSAIKLNPEAVFLCSKVRVGTRIIGKPLDRDRLIKYMQVAHVGAMHKASLFDELGFFDENFKISGDYEFLLRSDLSSRSIFLDIVTADMGYHGVSNQQAVRALLECLRAKEKLHLSTSASRYFIFLSAVFKYYLRKFIFSMLKLK